MISRISFTGPGGVEKVVKVLKELAEKLNTAVTEEDIEEILSSYYTKEEVQTILSEYVTDTQIQAYYTKEQVDLIVSALGKNSYRVAWDGSTQPVVANIPAGVTVTYNNTNYTGTLSASNNTINSIYLVGQDMYVTSKDGDIYSWVFAGTTELELNDYATKTEVSQLRQKVDGIPSGIDLREYGESKYNLASLSGTNTRVTPGVITFIPGTYGVSVSIGNAVTYKVYVQIKDTSGTTKKTFTINEGNTSKSEDWELSEGFTGYVNIYTASWASVTDFEIDFGYSGRDTILSNKKEIEKLDGSLNKRYITREENLYILGKYEKLFPSLQEMYTVVGGLTFKKGGVSVSAKMDSSVEYIVYISVYDENDDRKIVISIPAGSTSAVGELETEEDFKGYVQIYTSSYTSVSNLKITLEESGQPSVIKNASDIVILQKEITRNPRLGTTELGRMYHHLNVESSNPIIPSQSLIDIAYAKALGFKVIEGNLQKCSDGVFLIKHGTDDNLGAGLVFREGSQLSASTPFGSVSSTDIRNDVTYKARWERAAGGHIPTLDEFCAECSRLDMIPYLRGIDAGGLDIARKYLPDERMIIEGVQRGNFKGMMTIYGPSSSVENTVEMAKTYGAPFFFGWSQIASATDEAVSSLITEMHKNGFLVAGAYINTSRYQHLLGLGLDFLASTGDLRVPPFDYGKDLNITGCGDSQLLLTGSVYDSTTKTIQMEQGDTVSLSSSLIGNNISKLCVRIVFEGTVDIRMDSNSQSFTDLVSNGENEIVFATALQTAGSNFFTITAKDTTVIKYIEAHGTVVYKIN